MGTDTLVHDLAEQSATTDRRPRWRRAVLAVIVLAAGTVGVLVARAQRDEPRAGPIEGWAPAAADRVEVVDAVLASWRVGDAEAATDRFADRSSYVRMGEGETGIAEGREAIAARIEALHAAGVRPTRESDVVASHDLVAFSLPDDGLAVVDIGASGTIRRWLDVVGGPRLDFAEGTAPAVTPGAVQFPNPVPGWDDAAPATVAVMDRAETGFIMEDLGAAALLLRDDVSFIEIGTGGTGQIQGIEDVVRTNRYLIELGATYARVSEVTQLGSVFAYRVLCPTCPSGNVMVDFAELDADGRMVRYVTIIP